MATAIKDRADSIRAQREASRASIIRAQEESAWAERERTRKFDTIRAERSGLRAARFVAAAE
jgi:hypothetical protein